MKPRVLKVRIHIVRYVFKLPPRHASYNIIDHMAVNKLTANAHGSRRFLDDLAVRAADVRVLSGFAVISFNEDSITERFYYQQGNDQWPQVTLLS